MAVGYFLSWFSVELRYIDSPIYHTARQRIRATRKLNISGRSSSTDNVWQKAMIYNYSPNNDQFIKITHHGYKIMLRKAWNRFYIWWVVTLFFYKRLVSLSNLVSISFDIFINVLQRQLSYKCVTNRNFMIIKNGHFGVTIPFNCNHSTNIASPWEL